METKEKPWARGKQILKLLYEHGPLSSSGLQAIMNPPITKSGVKQALRALKRRRLIVVNQSGLKGFGANFYQLSVTGDTRPEVSKMLTLPLAALEKPQIVNPDMAYSERCAIWSTWFGFMFGEADVARDIHYKSDPSFKMPFSMTSENWRLSPSILMRMPSKDENQIVTVGIDVDKHYYSSDRIVEKLKKIRESKALNGCIYIAPTDIIEATLSNLRDYRNYRSHKLLSHFDDNFFLFSNGQWSVSEKAPVMVNAYAQPVSLYEWMDSLRTANPQKPKELNSKCGGPCG
ncbi:MAG: hypothetical protein IT289_05850 [Oligoflexia bacterium]|nr:hypothetical protein [Oligoflexia bacterium]